MWFNKKTKRKYTRKATGPGKIYSKEEKLKYLKEFEAVGAPVAMFCKWYGIGLGTFKNWQDRYRAQGEDGLEDNRGRQRSHGSTGSGKRRNRKAESRKSAHRHGKNI